MVISGESTHAGWRGDVFATCSRCGLYVVAFRNRGHDSRHRLGQSTSARSCTPAAFTGGSSCTPITVPTTSTADFRTTRTAGYAGVHGRRSRGLPGPGGAEGLHGLLGATGSAGLTRYGYVGLDRLQRSSGSNRTHRATAPRICGSSRLQGEKGVTETRG